MPTLLDGIKESHVGPEPRVVASDVEFVLRQVVRPDDDDSGKSVTLIAERAGVSTRTIYRVLNPQPETTISLDLADRICIAAERHVSECRLLWPDGTIT